MLDGGAETEMWAATDVIWEAVHRLLRESEAPPQLVTLAVVRVAAELAVLSVLAGGLDQERLAEVMGHVGQGSPGS